MQRAVLDTLKSFLRLRSRYYNFRTSCIGDRAVADTSIDSGNDWTKILSVTGKAGTGKTKCLHSCIRYIIEKELTCLVATPTGYLASSYRAIFDEDIDANTIHSSFCIPIDRSSPQVNWALGTYDLIIIDEISMVSLSHFNHIFSSLKQLVTQPILLICGDRYQLPPITTVNNQTTNTTSVYDLESLPRICRSFNLTRQYRCVDEQYSEILNHLRCWKPTVDMLDKLHEGRLLHHSQSINDTDLLSIIRDNASSTFVTISRNAVTRINMLVLKNLFTANLHVGTVQMDNDNPPTNIFKGMRIILMQNRDKKNGVVNGQPGIVQMMKGMTILIKLPSGKTVSIYPVSSVSNEPEDDGSVNIKTCYPFVPGYAITICKSQGQTLDNVVVWFDTNNLGPGGAYVALSCVKALANIKFLTPLEMSHFHPALLTST